MKKLLFLLAVAGLVGAAGCQSTGGGNSTNQKEMSALPDQGNMPTGPAGGGTKDEH